MRTKLPKVNLVFRLSVMLSGCFYFDCSLLYCASPGKHRLAHKPNSKPKQEYLLDLKEDKEKEEVDEERKTGVLSEEELWARLDDLERQEELQDARYR